MSGENTVPLPLVGRFIELHSGSGRSSLGRVQEASAQHVVVAIPSDAAIAAMVRTGDVMELVWPGPGGVQIQGCLLAERHGGPQLELWEFTPTGPAHFEQRRHDPRVSVSGAITVTVVADYDTFAVAPLAGSLVDISAMALQCLVDSAADDVVVTSGTRVRCEFALAGTHVSVNGVVHSAWTEGASASLRVVVQFDPDQAGADVVAAYVTSAATGL